ncbi:hypothetical protein Tco_0591462 [Tanacetum coccineum]
MVEDKESDEANEASEDDKGELMKHLVIKKDDDITIDAIPLATKLPVIIDYKIHKEGCYTRNRREDWRNLWTDSKDQSIMIKGLKINLKECYGEI